MPNGFLRVTVSIEIEGQKVCYSYSSLRSMEEVKSLKMHIERCEEIAAAKAYKALAELYCTDVMPLQRVQSYHKPSSKKYI